MGYRYLPEGVFDVSLQGEKYRRYINMNKPASSFILPLRDGCFPEQQSAALARDARHEGSSLLRWERVAPGHQAPVVVYTDMCLPEALDASDKTVAWLIEPPSINPNSYAFVRQYRGAFDQVWTHQRAFAEEVGGRWYPFGGSHIPLERWGLPHVKDKDICLIASSKRSAPGHRLRHEVAAAFGDRIDVYGPDYGGFVNHYDVLSRYRYAVVIENERSETWFTEKLLDACACGCVPIYWGAEVVRIGFRAYMWDSLDMLRQWLEIATPDNPHIPAIVENNKQMAFRYRCPEDYLFRYAQELA